MTRPLAGLLLLALGLTGCRTVMPTAGSHAAWARFYLEAADGGALTVTLPKSGVQIGINAQPVLTEGDLADVALVQVDLGKCFAFHVAPSATRDLYRLTAAHPGRRLVLVVDGAPLGARRIDGPLADGVVFVFVELADELLPQLVDDLKKSSAAKQRELARKG